MNISTEQLAAVRDGTPLRLASPELQQEFVLVRADVYDRAQAAFDAGDFDPREAMPLIWQAMRDDWESPEMDAYDNYPEKL